MPDPSPAPQPTQTPPAATPDDPLNQQAVDQLTLAISLAESKIATARRQIRFCRWRQFVGRCAHFYASEAERLRRLVRLSVEFFPVGILIGSALGGAAGYFLSASWVVALLALCLSALTVTALLYIPHGEALDDWIARIRRRSVKLDDERVRLSLQVNSITAELAELNDARSTKLALIIKRKLQESAIFRRKEILARDWKSLRSVPLASFLQEAFRELEYTIEATRAGDDQGANLVVSKSGHKLAVRVKGYFDSVTESAVQESSSVRDEFDCDGCMVITNSRFTPTAQDRARQINCVLIDESYFPSLVLGYLDPWDQFDSLRINAELTHERNSPRAE